MQSAVKSYLKGVDWGLITEVLLLSVLGFFVVFSATSHGFEVSQLWKKQLFWFSLSLIGMFVFSRIDYRFWIEASYIFYWIAILSLLVVLVIGDETNGAKRWIKLGILSYQPSELAKFAVLLVLARYIGSRTVELFYLGRLFFLLAMLGLPLVLIFSAGFRFGAFAGARFHHHHVCWGDSI